MKLKRELISKYSSFTKKADAELELETFIKFVENELIEEGGCSLPGLGKFEVIERNERPGYNPATREHVIISATKVIKFRPRRNLKAKVSII